MSPATLPLADKVALVTAASRTVGRLVTRQEIADVILQLCAGPFGSLTGQTLRLDGGWTLPVWDYHVGPVEGPAGQE